MKKMLVPVSCLVAWVSVAFGQDVIRGTYSYTYGDGESLVEARQTCRDLAVRDAIESYYLYVESSSRVENNMLKEDIVGSLAAGYLKNLTTTDQKEEGRTLTLTVEAEVNPEEVKSLVEKKLGEKPPPSAEPSSAKPIPAASQDFAVLLSKYENRAVSAEKQLDQNRYDQALAQLQDMDTLLASFPRQSNNRFQTLMMNSLSLRNRILIDFARWDRVRAGGRRIRERASERAIRMKLKQMEAGLIELRQLTDLTEKQKAIRLVWLLKCQQLASKLKNAIG
jgi:hypothetical protein